MLVGYLKVTYIPLNEFRLNHKKMFDIIT
jgi:hypothetical protein